MPDPQTHRKRLLLWYGRAARDLPWRHTRDPYAIWLSEIMLQQTRVAAVIPYFDRFLREFPTVADLAAAPDDRVLAAWAGLGYYSRARNMLKAARAVASAGAFPCTYEGIRALPGVGEYTAAAIASIAFAQPHAALDGNVARVLSRLLADPGDIKSPATRKRLQSEADTLIDPRRPGDFNQAMMELGATVCLPRNPECARCPLGAVCAARQSGRERELPIVAPKPERQRETVAIYIVERDGKLLVRQRGRTASRMPGFWELPDLLRARGSERIGSFRHSIVNHDYTFEVRTAVLGATPPGHEWKTLDEIAALPVTTASKKAFRLWIAMNHGGR